MKLKTAIKTRMIISILLTSVVIFSINTYIISSKSKELSKDKSKRIYAIQNTSNTKSIAQKLEQYSSTLNTMAVTLSGYYDIDESDREYKTEELIRNVGKKYPQLSKVSCTWDTDESEFKIVSNPTTERVPGKIQPTTICKFSAPIVYSETFVGQLSIDIEIDSLIKDLKNDFGYDEKISTYLVSNEGIVAYSKKHTDITQPLSAVASQYYNKNELESALNKTTETIIETNNDKNKPVVVSVLPIMVDGKKCFTLCQITPVDVFVAQAKTLTYLPTLLLLLAFAIIGAIVVLLGRHLEDVLRKINECLTKISKGDLSTNNTQIVSSITEIETINEATQNVVESLVKASAFTEEMSNNKLDAQFEALSENDKLGNALINLRNNLQKNQEETEKRKIADEKVNWATLGLAKFGEILHADSQNINELTYEILRHLIKYIDVNQGAMYVLDETQETPEYEMTAAIAYDRRKFMHKRFGVGEDLVGRCAFEHKTIYMTALPKDYITITSGMGSATASTLLLVPLLLDEKVFGIIELASFSPIEEHKINFVEKLAESIASTISTVKVNERTSNLLYQSKIQAEELASKEEEMRQNMEELQATQEEAARRENESNAILDVINDNLIIVEYDMSGTITNVNETYLKMLNKTADEMIGKKMFEGYDANDEKARQQTFLWNNLRNGQIVSEDTHLQFHGKDIWLKETYTPIMNDYDQTPYKVIKVGINITEQIAANNTINQLEAKVAEYATKIDELETMLNNNAPIPTTEEAKNTKKTTKTVKEPQATTNELFDEVGEQKPFTWENEFEVGNIEIDEQLKQLTTLANNTYAAFRAEKSKKELKDSLRSLIDFAAYHFGTISAFLDETNFENKKTIKQHFKVFTTKLNEFQELYINGKIKSADGLMLYMTNWFKQDIELMKDFATSLKK